MSDLSVLLKRIPKQSLETKVYALQLYIMTKLRVLDANEQKQFLNDCVSNDSLDIEKLDNALADYLYGPELLQKRVKQRLARINLALEYDNLDAQSTTNIYSLLAEIENRVMSVQSKAQNIVGRGHSSEEISIAQSLEIIEKRQQAHNSAMTKAMEMIIDRLLATLNPETAENQAEQSRIAVGPLKKAAVLASLKEKYEQVLAYQQQGKMLRDFKVHYNSELKKQTKDSRD